MERERIAGFFGASWVDFMTPFVNSQAFTDLLGALKKKKEEGENIFPPQAEIFRAFRETPLDEVRVIILGMDPYPAEGYANGLAFSHLPNMKKTGSMDKIIEALEKDAWGGLELNKVAGFNTELLDWCKQGVLLLNSSLTVKEGDPGSHSSVWKPFTEYFCQTMKAVKKQIIWNMWGKQAEGFSANVDVFQNFVIVCEHPSKAAREMKTWECTSFSKTNAIITANRLGDPINW